MKNLLESLLQEERQVRTHKLVKQAQVWMNNSRFNPLIVRETEGCLKLRIALCKRQMTKKGFLSKGWEPEGETVKDKLCFCEAMLAVLSNY